jgi:hypothetical protein
MKRQLEIQTNHKYLTPEGLPSHHVYDENKKNVAAFVSLEDALLFVAAVAQSEGRDTSEASPSNSSIRNARESEILEKPTKNQQIP